MLARSLLRDDPKDIYAYTLRQPLQITPGARSPYDTPRLPVIASSFSPGRTTLGHATLNLIFGLTAHGKIATMGGAVRYRATPVCTPLA